LGRTAPIYSIVTLVVGIVTIFPLVRFILIGASDWIVGIGVIIGALTPGVTVGITFELLLKTKNDPKIIIRIIRVAMAAKIIFFEFPC